MIRLLLIAGVFCSGALAANPVEDARTVALSYLDSVVEPEGDIDKVLGSTAISPHLGPQRRGAVLTLLGSMRADWVRDQTRFEALDAKVEGDFGAVLVKSWSELNPVKVEVLAIGMMRQGEAWNVAPLPGSFDAVFLGFDEKAEQQVAEIEGWMGIRRMKLLETLGSAALEKFRRELDGVRPPVLTDGEPKEIAEAFLEACNSGEAMQVLAFLGGPGENPSSAWFETMNIVSLGLAGKDARRQWRRMVDPDVIRLVTQVSGSRREAEFTILFFDPHEARVVENWKIALKRGGDHWEVILPAELRYADRDEEGFMQITHAGRRWQDRRTREGFRERFEEDYPPVLHEDPEAAATEITRVLREGTFPEFAGMLRTGGDLSKVEARVQLAEAAEMWSEMDGGTDSRAVEMLEVITRDHAAVVVLSRIEPAKVGWVELYGAQLLLGEDGWAIAPGVRVPGEFEAITEPQRLDQEAAWESYSDRLRELRERAAEPLEKALVAWSPPAAAAVEEEVARTLVKDYREGLARENNVGILNYCAVIDPKSGVANGLRTLSYEFRGGRAASAEAEIITCHFKGGWCGVSVFVPGESHSEPSYPLYLVVPTEKGARILIDVDLRLATNKGRSLLNERTLKRLSDHLENDQLELVRDLFQGHVEMTEKKFEEWEKSNK